MSFDTNIRNLATAIATNNKQLKTLINGNLADLSSLTTVAKTSLLAAVNEVNGKVAAVINDAAANNVTTSTYSASKITTLIATAKAEILGGASSAYDTLLELQQAIQADDTAISNIMASLAQRLRVDTNAQGLNSTQQANGRTNLDVWSKSEVGPIDTDYAAIFTAALA